MIARLVVKHLFPLAFFDINMRHFESMAKFHNISLNFPITSGREMHLSNLIQKVHHTWNYPMLQMYPLSMGMLSCSWQF